MPDNPSRPAEREGDAALVRFDESYRAGFNSALELIAKSFENIEFARARYDAGIDWSSGTGLGAFSPYQHALSCAAVIRKMKSAIDRPRNPEATGETK